MVRYQSTGLNRLAEGTLMGFDVLFLVLQVYRQFTLDDRVS